MKTDTIIIPETTVIQEGSGQYTRVHLADYSVYVDLDSDRLVVNDRAMRLEYRPSWAIKAQKTVIGTCYTPMEFFKHFIIDEFWRSHAVKLCKHVLKNGQKVVPAT